MAKENHYGGRYVGSIRNPKEGRQASEATSHPPTVLLGARDRVGGGRGSFPSLDSFPLQPSINSWHQPSQPMPAARAPGGEVPVSSPALQAPAAIEMKGKKECAK